ncbi:hypothetical protein G6F56_005106 [Rhizopus delemar]|nr:hypothetical protein G6F56_005106 [Rhizopus delemar]
MSSQQFNQASNNTQDAFDRSQNVLDRSQNAFDQSQNAFDQSQNASDRSQNALGQSSDLSYDGLRQSGLSQSDLHPSSTVQKSPSNVQDTPRSISSNVSEYGSSNSTSKQPSSSNLTADSNAFFESHHDQEDIKLSPAERAKKLEKEMEHTDFDQRRTSQGNADKMLNIGKSKDFKIE